MNPVVHQPPAPREQVRARIRRLHLVLHAAGLNPTSCSLAAECAGREPQTAVRGSTRSFTGRRSPLRRRPADRPSPQVRIAALLMHGRNHIRAGDASRRTPRWRLPALLATTSTRARLRAATGLHTSTPAESTGGGGQPVAVGGEDDRSPRPTAAAGPRRPRPARRPLRGSHGGFNSSRPVAEYPLPVRVQGISDTEALGRGWPTTRDAIRWWTTRRFLALPNCCGRC